MLRNLILAIFLLALALPAVAMPVAVQDTTVAASDCHGQPAPEHDGQKDEDAVKMHNCVGCIAPCISVPIAPSMIALPFIVEAQPAQKMSGTVAPPNPPPPRD